MFCFLWFIKHPKHGEGVIKKHKKLRKIQETKNTNWLLILFLISQFQGFYHGLLRCVLNEVAMLAASVNKIYFSFFFFSTSQML